MKKENIRKIANDFGVENKEVFIDFLSHRFPNESDNITSYFAEWAERFNSGEPEKWMDNTSLSVYRKALNGGFKND
jgi:two-component sensor histidine kinase